MRAVRWAHIAVKYPRRHQRSRPLIARWDLCPGRSRNHGGDGGRSGSSETREPERRRLERVSQWRAGATKKYSLNDGKDTTKGPHDSIGRGTRDTWRRKPTGKREKDEITHERRPTGACRSACCAAGSTPAQSAVSAGVRSHSIPLRPVRPAVGRLGR